MKESGLRIRVDNQLREDFLVACKSEDLTAAQVLRAFMRSYIEQHFRGKQPDLFSGTPSSSTIVFGERK